MGPEDEIGAAAESIDELLGEDDGRILAGMAYYRSSISTMFGKTGMVDMMREAIDASAIVSFFSRRSRAEVDPGRPEINLRVDDGAAVAAYPQFAHLLEGLERCGADAALNRITSFKSSVIFEEVCKPLATTMSDRLRPHWEKAKAHLLSLGIREEDARMLIYNMFVVRVGSDASVPPADRMCTISMLI
jgi:hypothetical protein